MTQELTNIYGLGIAGEDLVTGDIVKIHTDGLVRKIAAVEATNAFGVVYSGVSSGQKVSVIVSGLATVRYLIEDTDGASGYDKAIVSGDLMVISGKAAGTYLVGQAFSPVGGTAQATAVSGMVVGKFIGEDAGSDAADTYGTMLAMVNFMN